MSVLNENISLKIRGVHCMTWEKSSVSVAPRPYCALVYRCSGKATLYHDNLIANTEQGDVFYMPANYAYKADYPEKNEILVIHFESDSQAEMENFKLQNAPSVLWLFQKLYAIWEQKDEGYYYSALATMCEIMESISRQQIQKLSTETVKAFEEAVKYMEQKFTDTQFSVQDVVEKAHMSSTYFRKLFLQKFNTTPAKYILLKRMSYAEKLLSGGQYSVKEAAQLSGFSDEKYFSRAVKKEYGVPPSKLYCKV